MTVTSALDELVFVKYHLFRGRLDRKKYGSKGGGFVKFQNLDLTILKELW